MPFTRKRGRRARGTRKVRRKGLTKTQVKTVKSIAKKTLLSMSEKKVFGVQAENQQLYHNKPYYVGNILSCKQGVKDDNGLTARDARVGDEILIRNVNVRLWLSNKLDRPNVMYKCYLFWYDSDTTLADSVVFFTQTNKMLDRINNEQISIIDQQTIFSGPSYSTGVASDPGSAKEHSYLATLNGNWKARKITYDDAGTVPKKRDIGMVVVCYDAYGTLQTANIASFAYNQNVKFVDP